MIFFYEHALCHHPSMVSLQLPNVKLMTFGVLVGHTCMVDNPYP